jgi:hypothetical protein
MEFWRRHNIISGLVGALSWACSVVVPVAMNVARADEVVQEAAKGRDTGANFLLQYRPPTVVDAPPPADPSEYFDGAGKLKNEIWSRELFPGYDPGDPAQLDGLKGLRGTPDELTTQGVAKKIELDAGAGDTNEAYRALGAAAANPTHAVTDMRAEGFLDKSREIIKGESPVLDSILMACEESVTAATEDERTVRLEELVACPQAAVGAPSDCEVTRNFVLEAVETKTVLTVTAVGGAATGNEHWDDMGMAAPVAGLIGMCEEVDHLDIHGPTYPFPVFLSEWYERKPWPEPEYGARYYYSGAYCGTHAARTPAEIVAACTASANAIEGFCRNRRDAPPSVIAPTWSDGGGECWAMSGGPPFSYAACPAGREASCTTARTQHYDACVGSSAATPMNGTATLTASAIGAAETLSGVALLGTTVDITESTFDLATHGLAPGAYAIAAHVVDGSGITAHTLLDGGSNGSNWDYQFEVTAANADSFTVEATLYRIAANDFTFTGCTAADVTTVADGSCAGSVTCTDAAAPCRTVDGVELCEHASATDGVKELLLSWGSVSAGVPQLCWAADVEIAECAVAYDCVSRGDCAPSCGDLPPELQAECLAPACWIDASGVETCLDSTAEDWVNNLGDPGWVDDCAEELMDVDCRLLPERPCVEGMEDHLDPGRCLLRQVFFDCGKDVTIPADTTEAREVSCGGHFRCFGDECAGTEVESNPDFAKAATAASMMTEASKDVNCAVPGDPTSCTLFEGSVEKCRDLQGSWLGLLPDCCKDARKAAKAAGSFSEYMQLAKLTYELAQKPMVASYLSQSSIGTAINSVLDMPGDVLGQATGAVKSAISNGFNSALKWAGFNPVQAASSSSGLSGTVAGSATGFGPIQQFVATGVKNFLTDIGMETFADSLFSSTAEGIVTDWAASGLGQMIGSIISFIGWVYLIYQIVKIIASLIFKCKESELSFGVQLRNRMCHYVGSYCSKRVSLGFTEKCLYKTQSYCCFSSPLSRIMVEQMRAQGIGPAWGTGKRPNCEGIAIAQLEAVDWSRVDLSEWEAILFEAGLVPDPRDPPTNFVPTATHAGLATGPSGEGLDSVTLNRQAIESVLPTMDEGRFLLKGEDLTTTDPELMPWYD